MTDWPEELVSDIARRRAIPVLGAGISKHAQSPTGARPPSWEEFLEAAHAGCPGGTSRHISAAIKKGDYLHACEWLRDRFDEGWNGYLQQVFQAPQFAFSEVHKKIVDLDNRIVFSLNFDDIFERCATAAYGGDLSVKHYYDEDFHDILRGRGRYVVKAHGSLHNPSKVIFTQQQYASARVRYSSFYQSVTACLLTHSFYFIGAGYSDPDVSLLLENVNFGFPSSRPHYFVTSSDMHDDLKSSLRKNRNLKTIVYTKKDQQHSGLIDAIQDLGTQVDDARQVVRDQVSW